MKLKPHQRTTLQVRWLLNSLINMQLIFNNQVICNYFRKIQQKNIIFMMNGRNH